MRGPTTPGYWHDPERTRSSLTTRGYGLGDAIGLVDPADPSRGFTFQGRIAEDFKLSTGTWVQVGPLRAALLLHFGDLVQDVVIAAPDREDVRMLVFPNAAVCRRLAGVAADAPVRDALDHAAIVERFTESLAAFCSRHVSTSTRVSRVLLLEEPPSIDGRDHRQGSINQRPFQRRRALVDQLYPPAAPGHRRHSQDGDA